MVEPGFEDGRLTLIFSLPNRSQMLTEWHWFPEEKVQKCSMAVDMIPFVMIREVTVEVFSVLKSRVLER